MLLASVSLSVAALQASALPESDQIDALLAKDWQEHQLKPNPPASDDVLVRRLYLDIVGRIPTLEETQEFVRSTDAMKRMKLIDRLLSSDGYASHMFNYWADQLRLTDDLNGKVAAKAYAQHVKHALKENKPYDRFVHDLITAEGGVWDNGAIGFYTRDEDKLDHLAYAVQVFLGTSIVCAQCHNHPFEKWTEKEYYGLAAFTYGMGGTGRKSSSDPFDLGMGGGKNSQLLDKQQMSRLSKEERNKYMEEHAAELEKRQQDRDLLQRVLDSLSRNLIFTSIAMTDKLPQLPADYKYPDAEPGETVGPRTIFGHDAVLKDGDSRLESFANWVTSPENPRFTTVIANRMWKKVFGLGLIEPVDDITDATAPSNGALMSHLTRLMIEKRYSLKSFLRVLYNTDAYQRTATMNEVPAGEIYHFTGPVLRRMSAEQIWDSLVTLAQGNIDSATSEEYDRVQQYLANLKLLVTTVHAKGADGMLELAKSAPESDGSARKKGDPTPQKLPPMKGPPVKQSPTEKQAPPVKQPPVKQPSFMNLPPMEKAAMETSRPRKPDADYILVKLLGEEKAQELQQSSNPKKPVESKKPLPAPDKAALTGMNPSQRQAAIQMGANVALNTRASELHSPERAGHLLRTFGQSDREQIANANDDASVGQALAMLNSPITIVLNNPLSRLQQDLSQAQSPTEKMDLLYLSLLSRLPNHNERPVLDQVIHDRGDKATEDVLHALLTGAQFLYIQ